MEITLTQDNFDSEVTQFEGTVLVDFWAPWCGPCQMLAPIIEEVAGQVGEGIKVGKVNVDENQGLAQTYNISSIPNVIIFKNGQPTNSLVGLRSKQDYLDALK